MKAAIIQPASACAASVKTGRPETPAKRPATHYYRLRRLHPFQYMAQPNPPVVAQAQARA